MKKLLALMIAGILALSACGAKEEPKKEEAPKVEEKKEEPKKEEDSTFELGKEIDMGSYVIKFTGIKKSKANENKDALKFIYDITNKASDTFNAESLVGMKGFQNGVETEFVSFSDDIDIDTERADMKPNGQIKNAEKGIIVEDFSKKLEISLIDLQGEKEIEFTVNPADYK